MFTQVKISVRSLVEYVFRSGSIEAGFQTGSSLIEGTRAHQKIQATYGETDEKEVYVKAEIPYEQLMVVIEGRCDGLLSSEEGITVEEIKSTRTDLDFITAESYPVHWAQAKCYAYMYAKEHDLREMHVQLTYVHVETEEQKIFTQTVSIEELECFVLEVVKGYGPYALARQRHAEKRNISIKGLPFPFDRYREGQRKLAGAVYKTISEQKTIFAKAPTGIGKTISTLFPSVKAIGEGMLERIVYLTAKTITRTTAEEAFSLMQEKGLCMNTVTITAKDKVCFKDETRCQKEYCEFANGYYDRINEAVLDVLSTETNITRPLIEAYARKHTVCPFEFSLDLAYAADVIICDYNYIFDPQVALKRFFEEQKKQTVLLVDEAHNLVDRAREMFSADLQKSSFLQLKREFKGYNEKLYKAANLINNYFIAVRKKCGEQKLLVMKDMEEELTEIVEMFMTEAEKELMAGNTSQLLLDTYFSSRSFLKITNLYDERYMTYVECEKSDVRIKLFCLDPSHLLQKTVKGYRSKVYFSATLMPLHYFQNMLGGKEEDYTLAIPSPFSKEQLEVFIQPLSTRYHDRERTKEPIAAMLYELIKKKPGNYLAFFPSYHYLHNVYEVFTERHPDIPTIIQNIGMSEEERENFLESFQAESNESLIGFAVMGGIFSEGVDLKGDRLNGVIVVGVGLPQLCLERNIIKDYFNDIGRNGYDYSYVFPGINKVLQAGGRLIRSEYDTGTIVLIDDRFLQPKYQMLLPDEWKGFTVIK
ncbi:ATP-dependent DNA helicase [Bacillus sp. 165]|uniref:ATP-dependent DNA helicase n=1 Tax=Bacillus sp. 165 TaxID=1529117 RepID=UPI001ADBC737|nr:ATP-dependent DNA helicase [Bacillus sp. 165]MBO9131031.1 ATP-dependent DNA helicase [Bacillus sp. 165]